MVVEMILDRFTRQIVFIHYMKATVFIPVGHQASCWCCLAEINTKHNLTVFRDAIRILYLRLDVYGTVKGVKHQTRHRDKLAFVLFHKGTRI